MKYFGFEVHVFLGEFFFGASGRGFFFSCVLLQKDLCRFKSFFLIFLMEIFFALEGSFLFFEVCFVLFLFLFEDFTVNYEVEALLDFRIGAGRACLMFVVIPT